MCWTRKVPCSRTSRSAFGEGVRLLDQGQDQSLRLTAIDEGFAEHRLYAKAKFESIAERLKAITDKGGVLVKCASCSFEAAERDEDTDDVFSSRCHVCNGYAHYVAHADAWIVADAAAVPEHAYERRDHISAVLKAQFLLDVANRSRVTGMAAILIHTHPDCSTWPAFSKTDDDGEAQLAPYLSRRGAPVKRGPADVLG